MRNEDIGRAAYEAMLRRDTAWFTERLAPSIAGVLDADQLTAAFDSIRAAFGPPVRAAEPVAMGGPASGQISMDCVGQRGEFVLLMSLDDAGLITGMNVLPKIEHPLPRYAGRDAVERAVEFAADPAFPLEGTLTLPPGGGTATAGVVLVHGSGPNDRDEAVYGAKPFLDLALGLAARGIATLRYDKRTRTYGRKVELDVRAEVIDDAVAAVALLRSQDGVGPVFVLGHSLGGTLAPAIAARAEAIAGIVIVAGATRPMREIVHAQVDHLLATTTDELQRASLERLRAGLEADTGELLGLPATYWQSLDDNGPARVAPSLRQPALVLQGGRDYQVTMADFAGWKALLPAVPATRFVTYPELNHLLAAGSGVSTAAEYLQPCNVDQRVVDDIADWIGEQLA